LQFASCIKALKGKMLIIPPFRFATVESEVFRGAYPTLKNFRFLRRLNLASIVSLIPEAPNADLKAFCEEEKISIVHFKVKKYNEEVNISTEEVSMILDVSPYWFLCSFFDLDRF
jgi:tyrosine-protein phosphatase OCA6